jgi:hypothetical protein
MPDPDDELLRQLLETCRQIHLAWINGDAGGSALPEDGTIMGAVGGHSFGGSETSARQAVVAAHWESGVGSIEFLNGGRSGDLAWLAFLERARVVFQDAPAQRRWDLRVTEIFRQVGDGWERVHRHADPLVDRRPLNEVADLLHDP